MRIPMLLCWGFCWSPVIGAQEALAAAPTNDDRVFIEVVVPKDSYFIHETIDLVVRFGVDREFLRNNLIQPFRNQLDIPVRMEARWLQELPGAITVESDAPKAAHNLGSLSFVLNDGHVTAPRIADRKIGGQEFVVVEIERHYLPDQVGTLMVPAPILRYSHTTRFTESFLNGRVPEDRHDSSVTGNSLSLTIAPLPEDGRPREFTGAVGRFSIRSEIDSGELDVGKSFNLVLHIEGEGNLSLMETPSLDDLDSFHVYGKIEDVQQTERKVTYDLVPLSVSLTEVPSISFAFFDPAPPAGYRTVATEPIPIQVRPDPDAVPVGQIPGSTSDSQTVPGEDNILNLKPEDVSQPDRGISPALVVAVLLLPAVFVLGFLYRRRMHLRNRVDPADVRARGAAAAFRSCIDKPDTDVADALAEYLAAHLRCPVSAVIAPELREKLLEAGLNKELATRTATALHGLIDARFGGNVPPDSARVARELVDALDPVLQPEAATQ